MWDLIVSVPDHCISFYFALLNETFLQLPMRRNTVLLSLKKIRKQLFKDLCLLSLEELISRLDKTFVLYPFI